MMDFLQTKVLGLDITPIETRGALISKVKGKFRLIHFFKIDHKAPLPDVKQLDTSNTHPLIVTALPSPRVLLRTLDLPPIKNRTHLDSIISFQAEPTLPYPLEEAAIAHHLLKSKDKPLSAIVYATKKEALHAHLQEAQCLGYEPDRISVAAEALAALLSTSHPTLPRSIHIYADWCETCVIGLTDGTPHHLHSLDIGLLELSKGVAIDKKISQQQALEEMLHAESTPNALFSIESLRKWVVAIKKMVDSISAQMRAKSFDEISFYFLGKAANCSSLQILLERQLEVSFAHPNCTSLGVSLDFFKENALCLGLALSPLRPKYPRVDFRQKEWAHPRPFTRLKKPLLFYALLCGLTTLMAWCASTCILSSKRQALKEWAIQIAEMQRSLDPQNAHPIEYASLSTFEIADQIARKNKELELFPLALSPKIPTVSEFLAWLASHPVVNPDDAPPIRFERIQYSMPQHPSKKNLKERYRVRIDLEFTAQTARQARDFHEALLGAVDMIASKDDIQWNVRGNSYSTSFFLKDKTPYPQ